MAISRATALPSRPSGAVRPGLTRSGLAHLLLLGTLLEFWLLALCCVTALNNPIFVRSPVVDRWPALLLPAHWLFPAPLFQPDFQVRQQWPNLVFLGIVFLGATLSAAAAVSVARRVEQVATWHLLLVCGATLLFGLTLLFLPALPSNDLFSYLFYGRMSVLYHANPLVTAPAQFPHDPFLRHVWLFWRSVPSVYGPVWELLADGLTWLAQLLGGSLVITLLLFKSLTLLFHLANALLIWRILGLLAPRWRLVGTLLYAWNPLALLEFAGAGHNDVVMLFFLLLSVLCLVQHREILALVAFACSVDTKYIPLLLLPFYLWYVIQNRAGWRARALAAAWRLLLVAGVCLALYLPYWDSLRPFVSLLTAPSFTDIHDSLQEVVATALRRGMQHFLHWPPTTAIVVSKNITKPIATALFLALWLRLFPRARTLPGMLNAWWWALFLYLVIACGWFFPWYVPWLLVVAALLADDELTTATQLLAGGVLLFYCMDALNSSLLHGLRDPLAFGFAVGYLAWRCYRRRTTGLRSRPMPSTSASTTSPG